MSWLARIAGSAGAKMAAFAVLAGALLLFLARVFRAGRDAETARGTEAAHRHQVETATETSRSDEAMADPHSERARRVRRQFQRED